MQKHLAILPTQFVTASTNNESSALTRFLRLPHPRTRQAALFLPFSRNSDSETASTSDLSVQDVLLEVQAISPDEEKKRSWFIDQEIVSDGKLSLITPIDPLFLIISLIASLSRSSPSRFQSIADLFEAISLLPFVAPPTTIGGAQPEDEEEETDYAIGEDAARLGALSCVRKRLVAVCDVQEHEGTTLYRLSDALVLAALRSKITNLVDPVSGIFGPFASTILGTPRVVAPLPTVSSSATKLDDSVPEEKENLKPSEAENRFPTVGRGLSREGVGNGVGVSEEIQLETRQKSAIGIISNYLPPAISKTLLASYAFPNLTKMLESTTTSSVLSTTYLPGRASSSALGDEIAGNGFGAAAALAKKRKADAKGSRGVEMLKKVSTRGMKPLAAMFSAVSKAKPKQP